MGQEEVLTWLRNQRLGGVDDYFTISMIEKGVGVNQGDVRSHVNRLYIRKLLDIKHEGWWKRKFRIKSSIINDDKTNINAIKNSH